MLSFFVRYSVWHYLAAPRLMLGVWSNLFWYLGHLFSVGSLRQTLFAPWKRVVAVRHKRWNLEDFASAVLANLVSRIIGAGMRVALVVIGRLLQCAWVILGGVAYVGWFVLPVLIVGTFVYGLSLVLTL